MSRFSLRLLTREGCSLCEEAKPIVYRVARRRGGSVEEVDVDRAGLADRYGTRVPVVLGPDGSVLAEGRISSHSLSRSLKRRRLP